MSKELYKLIIKDLIVNSEVQLTLKEIVESTGIPKTTVHRIIKEMGYKCKKSEPWNKGLTKETSKSIQSASQKLKQVTGWKHDEETKKKISNSMKGKGGVREAGGRGIAYNYGDDVVSSDYELKIAQLLDDENIVWDNKNSVIKYKDNQGITRVIYLGFYLPDYKLYLSVRFHVNSDTRRRIRLAEKQNDIKVIIVDEMLFRRITYNDIKNILKNSLQN